MLNKNKKTKNLRLFYFEILLNLFLQGLDKSLDDLGWIFIQNILEKHRQNYDIQIHGFLFNENKLKFIAAIPDPVENYFLESLEKSFCCESFHIPPEPLSEFYDYQKRLIQLFAEADCSDNGLQNNTRCSFYYLTKGQSSLIKIEDHLNLGLNLRTIQSLIHQFKLRTSARPTQPRYNF